jgi:hypothetical protein
MTFGIPGNLALRVKAIEKPIGKMHSYQRVKVESLAYRANLKAS